MTEMYQLCVPHSRLTCVSSVCQLCLSFVPHLCVSYWSLTRISPLCLSLACHLCLSPVCLSCTSLVSHLCHSGWLVLGASRLRFGVIRPLSADTVKKADIQEVTVHRRFLSDSASLFLIYFLQLVVMAMYLSQEQLKLIPLLTIIFAFGR